MSVSVKTYFQEFKVDWSSLATSGVKAAIGVVALAAISAGAGSLMQTTGAGTLVGRVGEGLFYTGRTAFLAVAVPVYSAIWVFPNWLVKVALPEAARWSYTHIVIPFATRMAPVLELFQGHLIRAIETIYRRVLEPLLRLIEKPVLWVWNQTIIPVLKFGWSYTKVFTEMVMNLSKFIYERALAPFKDVVVIATNWLLDNGVIPVARAIYDYVLAPLGPILIRGFDVAFDYSARLIMMVARAGQVVIDSVSQSWNAFSAKIARG